jgi:hypothetical protein
MDKTVGRLNVEHFRKKLKKLVSEADESKQGR